MAVNPDIVFREEEEGAFLFDPQTDVLRCINKTGAFILKLCDGKRGLDDICLQVMKEYEVDVTPEQLRTDVEGFLEGLIDLNLILEKD